ncbi:MAG: hypothetical protein KAS23_06755, partial [Anaerohalosphaera sp.]|nr:hypothetical protein [Anaerohalosphaera sp.]
MKANRLVVTAIVLIMIISGLGTLAIPMNSGDTMERAPVDSPQQGAIRTVFLEDFTNSACDPCAIHNPDWIAAIRAKGYARAAPAFTHVHWPTPTDPMNCYSEMNTWADNRRDMYGITAVPKAFIDGENVAVKQEQAIYEMLIDDYGSILSPVKITTNGTIDGGTRNGTLNIHIEAVNDIPAGQNLSVMTYIWEDAINVTARFGSFPNGEIEQDWAVWLMLDGDADDMNNHLGEFIWSGGATAGDTIDVVRNFQCDAPWVLSEMGATVFLQNFNTTEVLNSAVDLFDGATPPAHDLGVVSRGILTPGAEANTTVPVQVVVYNNGDNDETNIEVIFSIDGVPQETKYVTSLPAGNGEYVDFDWNTPLGAGTYSVEFNVTAVPGESNLTNNFWFRPIEVTGEPEIWTDPAEMDFSVISNGIYSDDITIGNTGTDDCNFEISIGVTEETVGGNDSTLISGRRDAGNIFQVDSDTILWEAETYLNISYSTPLYHVVYEGDATLGTFNKISQVFVAESGTGSHFYSSGPINVPLTAGNYYYVCTFSWYNFGTFAYSPGAPLQMSFGSLQTGRFDLSGWPPADTINNGYIWTSAFYQRISTGPEQPGWISASPLNGTVPISTEDYVSVDINTSGVMAGFTDSTFISICNNDRDERMIYIPVNLTVVLDQRGCIFLNETLYHSESTATVTVQDLGLNTDSGTVQTVPVNVGSNTEPGG